MSDTLVVTSQTPARSAAVLRREQTYIARSGGQVLAHAHHGTVASGSPAVATALAKLGYQVAHYPDTHRLQIAGLEIDLAHPHEGMDKKELVPSQARATWPLHIIQFLCPPFPEWVEEVERYGIQRVHKAGQYALCVSGEPATLDEVSRLGFVTSVCPLEPGWKLDPRLRKLPAGPHEQLDITVFPFDEAQHIAKVVRDMDGKVARIDTPSTGRMQQLAHVVAELDPSHALELAALPSVVAVSWLPTVTVEGERESQIQAENLDGTPAPNTAPVTGYPGFLSGIAADGTGTIVSIVDSGVDVGANNNTNGHLDLRGRQVIYIDYNNVPTDQNGHGTHVAGIAIGNGGTGLTEGPAPGNFLWGAGAAPAARFVAQSVASPTNPGGSGLLVPAATTLTTDAVTQGASVQNNSWGGAGAPLAYSVREAAYDSVVRDANAATAALEPLTIVFAAGNAGGLPATIGDPAGAKNVITVGNSLNRRVGSGLASDDIRGIKGSSSRGPASGGRIKPDIVAPGTDVSSARSSASALTAIPNTNNLYASMSGTSMSAPHVTGACAVLTDWWRDRTGGSTPSPAMLKALLVNGAEDMAGGPNWRAILFSRIQQNPDRYQSDPVTFVPGQAMAGNAVLTQVAAVANLGNLTWCYDPANQRVTLQAGFQGSPFQVKVDLLDGVLAPIPNHDQGWGRVSLRNMVTQAPQSDRGPRLFLDQRHAFTNSGQSHRWRIQPFDPARPLRVTLAWTDAPGIPGDGTPLVNNLNLELQDASNTLWHGNPANFVNGFSTPGGFPDSANNVESVFIQQPNGVYDLIVRGHTVVEDARNPGSGNPWQDYALVVDNAVFASATPVSVSLLLDRSGSMVASNYVDVTRTTSKLFVDLLQPDDRIGVVSFSDTPVQVYSDGGKVDLIDAPGVKVAAQAAIDGIAFGGCTYMGAGLLSAQDQLNQTPGHRAIVLLSDGYDNKGCQPGNATRPWAVDVAAGLPNDLDVYTCAMGPASDQAKLEQIALLTQGQYYYVPTIDDLYEIYNYIRGNVSGDGVIVNTTSTASSSNVAAYVDCSVEQVVLSCQWHAQGLHWVDRTPKKPSEISVYLKAPDGKKIPANTAWLNRRTGPNYIIFTIDDPRPGRWQVCVETATSDSSHTPYTVGGWVRSPLQLQLSLDRLTIPRGSLLAHVGMQIQSGRKLDIRYTANVRHTPSIADLTKLHKGLLEKVKIDPQLLKDGMNDAAARLIAADQMQRAAGKPSLFTSTSTRLRVLSKGTGKEVIEAVRLGRPLERMARFEPMTSLQTPNLDLMRPLDDQTAALLGKVQPIAPSLQRVLTHSLNVPTKVAGSYTLRLTASGVDARTQCRFERLLAQSFVVA